MLIHGYLYTIVMVYNIHGHLLRLQLGVQISMDQHADPWIFVYRSDASFSCKMLLKLLHFKFKCGKN